MPPIEMDGAHASPCRPADVSAGAEHLTGPCRKRSTRKRTRRIVLSAYAERLEALAAEAADRCTSCGKCFEVCPTAREIGLDAGRGRAACRRAQGLDPGRGAGGRPAEMAGRLRRQRALQRRLPRGHQRPPMGDHRQDEGARGDPAARRGRRQRRQPLPPHGAGGAAARQHAAAVGDAEEDPGAGRAAHRRGAVLYRLQRAAHAAHRAERHGHPRRARARLRRGRRHRPLLRRLPVPGSRPADLRAHGPSHLPALRPVGRRQGADLVPDLHQEFRRAREGRRGAVVRPRPYQRISGRQPRRAAGALRGRSAAAPRGDPRASGHRRHGGEHRQAPARRAQSRAAASSSRIPASPMPAAARPPSSRSASRRSIAGWPKARSRPAPTPSSPCTIPAIARCPAPRRSIR